MTGVKVCSATPLSLAGLLVLDSMLNLGTYIQHYLRPGLLFTDQFRPYMAALLIKGVDAARICAINILSNLKASLGSLDKVARIVKLVGFVNCAPEFDEPHKVVNGCSDLLTEVLGDRGKHARSAVGMATLPLGAAVEVEVVVEIAP